MADIDLSNPVESMMYGERSIGQTIAYTDETKKNDKSFITGIKEDIEAAKGLINLATTVGTSVIKGETSIKDVSIAAKAVASVSDTVRENTEYINEHKDSSGQVTIAPAEHFIEDGDPDKKVRQHQNMFKRERNEADDYFAKVEDHFVYDTNGINFGDESDNEDLMTYSDGSRKFTGSTTLIDKSDPETKEIAEQGLDTYDQRTYNLKNRTGNDYPSPLSPLRPFTATDPKYAHKSLFSSYNRTLLPVADAEFRKGFKNIMISRPECYIMWNGDGLSEQAEYDQDFNSAYSRMPHICELLSPSYISGGKIAGTVNSELQVVSNWNYLLSNMIMSFGNDYKTSISTKEGTTKSIEGHTVLPGGTLESVQGGTLSITFRETKKFEVYECLKLWMLYIHKIRKGIFAPSYDGYMYRNNYLGKATVNANYPLYHPYDRALDYCCSIFENITNESMDQILYWDKWYGCYPIEATINGIDTNSGSISGPITVSATFRYQYKSPPCRNINLLEFNYNAGLVNHIGGSNGVTLNRVANHIVSNDIGGVSNYIGPLDLFTGTPYIVLSKGQSNYVTRTRKPDKIWVPHLRFAHCGDDTINGYANVNLTKSIMNDKTDYLVTT